ncbi:hypothetical protein Syun_013296 [Stephania yunnanensis]|uniref:Mitochondrial glycoprotein n=1 Tax=Stephania yunnanensis TaxID=152371 RepID=A0AAP0K143_9MAGN
MQRSIQLLKRSYRAARDAELLSIVQLELKHERSSKPYQDARGSLGGFVVDWDQERFRDVVLRRECESGEEIAVSALLEEEEEEEEVEGIGDEGFRCRVLMKVCVKKPGLRSLLQFDCVSSSGGDGARPDFSVCNACYLPSMSSCGDSIYKGPSFRSLDFHLQAAFKEYLRAKGIGEELIDFLLQYLHRKENDQYVQWLVKIESMLLMEGH